jgi:hypothetical protein
MRGASRGDFLVNDAGAPMDDHTLKFGLLMESAQAHQKLAETHLERLKVHTQELDGVVREEIRRTLIDELRAVSAESAGAAQALRKMKHAAHFRGLLWNIGIATLCTAIPACIAYFTLPTEAEISSLRQRRDALAQSVSRLEQQGGKADWRKCGESARFCVRIDRKAPVFGEQGDYIIVKGY